MYNIYLSDEDLKPGTAYPLLALLNEAANADIVDFLSGIANGIGSGYDYTSCYFWDELDEFDKLNTDKFQGLRIETENGEEITVLGEDLIYYLKILIERIPPEEFDKDTAVNLINNLMDDYRIK